MHYSFKKDIKCLNIYKKKSPSILCFQFLPVGLKLTCLWSTKATGSCFVVPNREKKVCMGGKCYLTSIACLACTDTCGREMHWQHSVSQQKNRDSFSLVSIRKGNTFAFAILPRFLQQDKRCSVTPSLLLALCGSTFLAFQQHQGNFLLLSWSFQHINS